MQKVQPAKNSLDMDFLNSMNKPIGGTPVQQATPVSAPVAVSRQIKATQIVVRTTEKEREMLKAYFMKHGVSLSKGIKIAIKYLEQQEKKGLVHFSDIGLY